MSVVLIKVMLISIMFISNLMLISLVHTLPKKNKTLKWNLDARFYLYSFSDIIDFVLIVIAMYTLPNMMRNPENRIIIINN